MVTDPRWANWKHSTSPIGVWMYELVRNGSFFKEARSILTLLSPLLILLKVCDREGATMGLIYKIMGSMVESLDKLADKVDPSRVLILKNMIRDHDDGMRGRFSMLHSPLHSVAFLLHPLYASPDQLESNQVMDDWYKYLARYTKNDINMQKRLREQHQKFVTCLVSRGGYITPLAHEEDEKERPVTWWESYGTPFSDLRIMALKVLSQGTSASPCERNWSSFSSIHTKKRNRLLVKNLDKLAFIQTNLRLLEKVDDRKGTYLEHDPKKIVFEEDEERLLLVQAELERIQIERMIFSPPQVLQRPRSHRRRHRVRPLNQLYEETMELDDEEEEEDEEGEDEEDEEDEVIESSNEEDLEGDDQDSNVEDEDEDEVSYEDED